MPDHKAAAEYPVFLVSTDPSTPKRFICLASPTHAVDIFETTDPHNNDPLGFEYRTLRSRPVVKRCETAGVRVNREEWFRQAAEMMLTHLGSIGDLVQICTLRRDAGMRSGTNPDYAGVIAALQEIKPSRRVLVASRMERGELPLLG